MVGVFFLEVLRSRGLRRKKKKKGDVALREQNVGSKNRHFSTEREPSSASPLARIERHERYLEPGAEEQATKAIA